MAEPTRREVQVGDLLEMSLTNPVLGGRERPADAGGMKFLDELAESNPVLGATPESMRLAETRKKYAGEGVSFGRAFAVQSVPFGDVFDIRGTGKYSEAVKRFQEGKPTDDDYETIARYEEEQAGFQRASEGFVGQLAAGLGSVPKIAGEAFGAGKVLGLGAKAAGIGQATTSAGRLGQFVGQRAALTPLMPSLYLEDARQRNLAQGRDPLDPKGFPTPLMMGAAFNLVLGTMQSRVGSGVPTLAGRSLVKGGVGAGETAAIEAGFGAFDEFVIDRQKWLPEEYKTGTAYGPIGSLLEGKVGEAIQHSTVTALTFAVFAGMHDRGPAARQKAQAVLKTHGELLADYKRRGVPADVAGRAVQSFYGRIQKAQETNPDLTRGEAKLLFEGLPDTIKKPLFDLVEKTLPEEPPLDLGRLERRQAEPSPTEAETQIPGARNLAEPPRPPESRPTAPEPPARPEPSPTPEVPPAATPAGSSRPARGGLQFGKPEPLTPGQGNVAERHALNKYGNASRIAITDAEGKPVGEATIAVSGATVYVPWLGGVGMGGGEGRGREAVFGHREILNLAERIAELYPDAAVLKYTPSEGRNQAGVERELDLAKVRARLAKREGRQPQTQDPLANVSDAELREMVGDAPEQARAAGKPLAEFLKEQGVAPDVAEAVARRIEPAATVEPAVEPVKPEPTQIPGARNLPTAPEPAAAEPTPPPPAEPPQPSRGKPRKKGERSEKQKAVTARNLEKMRRGKVEGRDDWTAEEERIRLDGGGTIGDWVRGQGGIRESETSLDATHIRQSGMHTIFRDRGNRPGQMGADVLAQMAYERGWISEPSEDALLRAVEQHLVVAGEQTRYRGKSIEEAETEHFRQLEEKEAADWERLQAEALEGLEAAGVEPGADIPFAPSIEQLRRADARRGPQPVRPGAGQPSARQQSAVDRHKALDDLVRDLPESEREPVREALESLTDLNMRNAGLGFNERYVINQRLLGRTLEAIGKDKWLGMTRQGVEKIEKKALAKLGETASIAFRQKVKAGEEAARLLERQGETTAGELTGAAEGEGRRQRKLKWYEVIENEMMALADRAAVESREGTLTPEREAEFKRELQRLMLRYDRGVAAEGQPPPARTEGGTGTPTRRPAPNRGRPDQQTLFSPPAGGEPGKPRNLFDFMEERQAERERLLAEREAALDARERELAERESRLAGQAPQEPAPTQPKKGKAERPTVSTAEGRQLVGELKVAIQTGLLGEGESLRGRGLAEVSELEAQIRQRAKSLLDRVAQLPEVEQKAIAYEVAGKAGRSAETARAEIERDLLAIFRGLQGQLTSPPPGQADQIPGARNLNEPVMGDLELLATARKEIGLPEQVEKVPPYVRDANRGVYLGKEEAVVTGKMMVGDVPRGLHEIAHHIALKNKFPLDPARLPPQVRLGFKQFDYEPGRPMSRTAMQEGFAEWFRRRTTGSLENLTPAQRAAAEHAEKLIREAGLTEYVDRQRARWDRLAAASAETRASKLMSGTGEATGPQLSVQEAASETSRNLLKAANEQVLDDIAVIRQIEKEAGAGTKASSTWQQLMYAAKSWAGDWWKSGVKTLIDGKWQKIGLSMDEIVAGAKEEWITPAYEGGPTRAGLYAITKHILSEASKHGMLAPRHPHLPPKVVKEGPAKGQEIWEAMDRMIVPEHELAIFREAMEEMKADREFAEWAEGFSERLTFAFNSTRRALASGDIHRLDPEVVRYYEELRPDYVEVARVLANDGWKKSAYAGGRGERVKRLIHARSGTGEPIVDPLVSYHKRLLLTANAMADQIKKNAVAELLQQPGMGKYGTFFEVDGVAPAGQPRADLLRELGMEEAGVLDVLRALGIERGEILTTTKPWPTDGTKPTVEWTGPDGKRTSMRINDRALYDLLTGQQADSSQIARAFNVVAHLGFTVPGYGRFEPLRWAGDVLKLGATGTNLAFQFRNIPRDAKTFWANTIDRMSVGELPRAYLTAYKGMIQSLMGHKPTDRLFRWFLENRGDQMRQHAFDPAAPSAKNLISKRSIWGVMKDALGVLGAGELAPRYLEVVNALRKATGKTKAELIEMLEAADASGTGRDPIPFHLGLEVLNAANEVTTPFSRLGVTTRQINKLTPFFGPTIAGLSKVARNWKDNPKGAAFTAAAILGLRAVYWAAVSEEDWWEELSAYDRYNNFVIPVGDSLYRLPGPRDLDLAGGGVLTAMLDAAADKNPDFKGLFKQSLDEVIPPAPLPTPARTAWDIQGNEDFLGRPIVPRRAEGLPWLERFTDFTGPYIARQMTGGQSEAALGLKIPEVRSARRSVDEYYERLKELEGERTVALRAGRPYAREREYQKLHRIESQMTAINQRLRGEMKRGRRLVAGERPSEDEARKLRARQTELARRALGK